MGRGRGRLEGPPAVLTEGALPAGQGSLAHLAPACTLQPCQRSSLGQGTGLPASLPGSTFHLLVGV